MASGGDPTTTTSMPTIPISNPKPIPTSAAVAAPAVASAPVVQPLPQTQPKPPQFLHRHYQFQPLHPHQQLQHQLGVFATQNQNQNQNQNHSQTHPCPQLGKESEQVLYPLASSGRGTLPTPRVIRSQLPDQMVTVANPAAHPPSRALTPASRSIVAAYCPPQVQAQAQAQAQHPRVFAPSDSPQSIYSADLIHAPYLHSSHAHIPPFSATAVAAAAGVRGISLHPLAQSKAASLLCSAPGSNGHNNPIDKVRDDTSVTVRDRKVRISDGASTYALCRSWLRNGCPEESQSQYGDFIKSLPKPSPTISESSSPKRKERDDERETEEDEKSVENLFAKELLQRHIKRAKKVRARLREERLQRIERYKSRLALLLPPLVEQCRNDTTAN